MKATTRLGLALAAATLLTSCASQPADPTAKKKSEEEYVYYTPTGSHIPIKVRKSLVTPTEEQTAASQRWMGEVQRAGLKPDSPPPGGR